MTSKIDNAFKFVFRALIEPMTEKNLDGFDYYIRHRFIYRSYLLMEILKYKKMINYNYWEFYCADNIGKKHLYSHDLVDFVKLYIPSRSHYNGQLTPEAEDAIREVNILSEGINDNILNRVCLLLYKMSQYGFPESNYMVSSASDILCSKDNNENSEVVKITKKFVDHPAFSHLNENYRFLLEKQIKETEKRISEETAFCNTMKYYVDEYKDDVKC